MRWEEEHSETMTEFFDGRDYRDGFIVKRFQVPTGNQKKQIQIQSHCYVESKIICASRKDLLGSIIAFE